MVVSVEVQKRQIATARSQDSCDRDRRGWGDGCAEAAHPKPKLWCRYYCRRARPPV